MEKIDRIKDFYFEHKFLIDCVILSVLFFANTFIPNFTYISFSFLFFLVLTTNLKYTLSYLFFSGAFCAITMPSSIILFLVCVVIYLVRFCYNKFFIEKHKFDKVVLKLTVIYVVFLLFPFKNIYDFHLIISVLFLVLVLFIFYLIINFAADFNIKINIRLLGYGLLISSIFAIFCNFVAPGLRSIGFEGNPFRFMALFFNPNGLAVTCELSIGILAYFICANKFNKRDVFAFIIFAVIGITSASKTYLILLALVLFLMFIFNVKKVSKQSWCFIGVLVIAAIVFVIVKFDVVLSMLNRFARLDVTGVNSNQFLNKLTTTRFDLWVGYIGYLLDNPWAIFFGRGLSAPIIGDAKPHNVYLSAIYKTGIVGAALLIAIIIFMLKRAKKDGKLNVTKAIIIPLMVCALLACIEDLIFHI